MGYLDNTSEFIFFPHQENNQDYFNICNFKSLPKRADTICHCFNYDSQLSHKNTFYFDPVEHFWFCGICPHYYPNGLASCVEILIYLDLKNRIFACKIMNDLKETSLLKTFIINFCEALLGEFTSLQCIFMIFRISGNQECPQLAVKVIGSINNQYCYVSVRSDGYRSALLLLERSTTVGALRRSALLLSERSVALCWGIWVAAGARNVSCSECHRECVGQHRSAPLRRSA